MNWIREFFNCKKNQNQEEKPVCEIDILLRKIREEKEKIFSYKSEKSSIKCGERMQNLGLTNSSTFKNKENEIKRSKERDKLKKACDYLENKYSKELVSKDIINKIIRTSIYNIKCPIARNYQYEIPCSAVDKIYNQKIDKEDKCIIERDVDGPRGSQIIEFKSENNKNNTCIPGVIEEKANSFIFYSKIDSGIYLQPVHFNGDLYYLIITTWEI